MREKIKTYKHIRKKTIFYGLSGNLFLVLMVAVIFAALIVATSSNTLTTIITLSLLSFLYALLNNVQTISIKDFFLKNNLPTNINNNKNVRCKRSNIKH